MLPVHVLSLEQVTKMFLEICDQPEFADGGGVVLGIKRRMARL